MRKAITPERLSDEYATACFLIEKELHSPVTEDYPAAKFTVALEEIEKYYKRQEEAVNNKHPATLR